MVVLGMCDVPLQGCRFHTRVTARLYGLGDLQYYQRVAEPLSPNSIKLSLTVRRLVDPSHPMEVPRNPTILAHVLLPFRGARPEFHAGWYDGDNDTAEPRPGAHPHPIPSGVDGGPWSKRY